MARYQYETSPRKLEPEYIPITRKKQTTTKTKRNSKAEQKRREEQAKQQKKKQKKQVLVVIFIFAMLLTISYRAIVVMEKFNEKKELEAKLATLQKENGQVEKDIKEVESTLDWKYIKQVATEELGMEIKQGTDIDLQKEDNVEVQEEIKIQEEKESILDKILKLFIK